MYNSKKLAKKIGVKMLWIKDDGLNPTGSLKDRASFVGVARAISEKANGITCASTGNAASSLAGLSACVGLPAFIFVPQSAPEAKIAQLLIFGSKVFKVKGTYEDAFELSMAYAENKGIYNRNSAINPYLVEGKKTASLEMCEQMGWNVPDYVFVSVGDGCTIAGLWKGFFELKKLGFIDRVPRIVGVQAKGAAPILKAWKTGKPLKPVKPKTLADSIAVGTPRNWKKAIMAITESHGFFIDVTDREILNAMALLGKTCGIFGEPAGVTGLAGIVKARKTNAISASKTVATIITGSGLKDIPGAMKAAPNPRSITPK